MIRRAQPWLGTLVDITIASEANPQAMASAFASVALVHRLMSFHDVDSDVSRFNRASAGALLEIDQHTWEVLRLARQVREVSGGCFNVACAPRLVELGYLPAPSACAPAYVPGDPTYELMADGSVRKISTGWIDVGGIAKGYAVDLAIGVLQRHGVINACVNAGGDLRVIGDTDWPIAIRAPHDPTDTGARLALRNAALATSANYFSARGQASPLIDGRDGVAQLARHSVSVRAPSCALADALTKVVMASGDAYHPSLAGFDAASVII